MTTTAVDPDAQPVTQEEMAEELEVMEDRLLLAGDFVADQGALGDRLWGQALIDMQQWAPGENSAWNLITHWSVQRGDALGQAPATFEAHEGDCVICAYLEEIRQLVHELRAKPCMWCDRGPKGHVFAPGPTFDGYREWEIDDFFTPFAWCKEPWKRLDTVIDEPGHLGDHQVSEAHTARWYAPTMSGKYAVLYRSYYRCRDGDQLTIEREDWYALCTDLNDPEGPKTISVSQTEDTESDDPQNEDLAALAAQSFAPELREWARYMADVEGGAIRLK